MIGFKTCIMNDGSFMQNYTDGDGIRQEPDVRGVSISHFREADFKPGEYRVTDYCRGDSRLLLIRSPEGIAFGARVY